MSRGFSKKFSLPRVNSFIYPFSNGLKPLQRKAFRRFVLWSTFLPSIKIDVMLALGSSAASELASLPADAQAQFYASGGGSMARGERGKRINIEQKAAVIAEYANSGTITDAARAGGVNWETARKIINNNMNVAEAVKKTAEERMREYADSRLDKVQTALDTILDDLPDKLQKSNALQSATVLGILMDKFSGQRDFNGNAVQVNVTFGNKPGDMDAFK